MTYKKIHPVTKSRIYSDTNFDVGDIVKKVPGSGADTLSRSEEYRVDEIQYVATSETRYIDDVYEYIHAQRLKVAKITNNDMWTQPNSSGYLAKNFQLLRKGTVMTQTIENSSPTLTREIFTKPREGYPDELETSYGEIKEHDSLSKAKAWCEAQISASIRSDNVYRRFQIFQFWNNAQAKQPEVEFAR